MKRFTFLRVLLWASAMAFAPHLNGQTNGKEAEPPADARATDDESNTVSAEGAFKVAADARG